MNDLDIIRAIEREIEIPLQQLPQEQLLEKPYGVVRAFAVAHSGKVAGLRLDYTGFRKSGLLVKLARIETVRLNGCWGLSDFSFLKELKGLTSLDLRSNNISDISFVADLSNLANIFLSGTKLDEPSEEVIAKGPEAIRSYFRQKTQGGSRIFEAKVLFVGEPGAGKTSLMNKFLDHKYVVDPKRAHDATLGINIHPNWPFPCTKEPAQTFKAHLWDFGGQNIQYYVHQFFLTERSLYILLVDDREDCANIDYWFNIIKLLGKGSPVLLVRNEKNISSVTGLDANKYRKRYGKDFEIVFREVNLVKDTSDNRLNEIESRAKQLLSGLPHVGEPLPSSWLHVRNALEELRAGGENHISFSRFQDICGAQKIREEKDQLVLSGYLHALGVILHYANDSTLAHTVFLNPRWITKAVYSILSDKKLENYGQFTRRWFLDQLASEGYTLDERDKILLLMQKQEFDLVYKLDAPGEESYLAPRLLPNKAPDAAHDWQRQGTLCFRYRYPFMPLGLINRLIVRLSTLLAEDESRADQVWREGAILQKAGCTALIKENITGDGLKVIDISVAGEQYGRRELLGHVRRTIEDIHEQSFRGIDYEELVPCHCEVCATLEEPKFFEFTKLRRYIENGRLEITCDNEKSVQDVSILGLLEGVVEEQLRKSHRSQAFDSVRGMPDDISSGTNLMRQHMEREDKLIALLEKAIDAQSGKTTHVYGPVGAVNGEGQVNQDTIASPNQQKSFLARTSVLVTIALGIWQMFFKNNEKKASQRPLITAPVQIDSTASRPAGTGVGDSAKVVAGKPE